MTRYAYIDWLRGLAVLLMIQTHVFNAWTRPELQDGPSWTYFRISGGAPAAMFMFLAGVSLALAFRSAARAGQSLWAARAKALRRAGWLLGMAFLLRLQFYLLGGSRDPSGLLRVDILNCMSVALMIVALLAAPRPGRRWNLPALGIALAITLSAPWVATLWPASWGLHLPTAYIYGPKPGVLFPLVPWAAFTFVGLAAGTLWSEASGDPVRMRRTMAWTAAAGLLTGGLGALLYKLPFSIYQTSEFWRTSPSFFLIRIGILLVLTAIAWLLHQGPQAAAFSPLRQLGVTSLLVYWVHVELCYGKLARPFRQHLDLAQSFLGFVLMTLAMLLLSLLRTRLTSLLKARRAALLTRSDGRATGA